MQPIAESRSQLYGSVLPAEFALQAGKVQNLRLAARALHGRLLPAGEVFSFWANVPRPARWRGFAKGRELREGCVIPNVGGGLCQLTNALYDAALTAGCEIVERHAHSRRLPGSLAAAGRDATVFWNYVDLRFRAPIDCRLEVELTGEELVVRLRPTSGPVSDRPIATRSAASQLADCGIERGAAESCETCGVTGCFRNPLALALPQHSVTAWLVDAWMPEHGAYLQGERRDGDLLFTPVESRRLRIGRYFWDSRGFARVHHARCLTLRRSILSRRLAAQGATRQRALLKMDARLARSYARRLPYAALHVVVSQTLLPFLWIGGHLAGRTFDVLMWRLPMAGLQERLDAAAKRWPASATLGDFRANSELVAAETAALAAARKWITPHSEIAALAGKRAVKLAWQSPAAAQPAKRAGQRIVFPAATLGRKGAMELRAVARELGCPLTLAGPVLEDPEFWAGCDARIAETGWLDDAAAVVLPAWVEHQPRRLLQAASAGIPVIASEACGLAGVPGIITLPNGDVEALAEAIRHALAGTLLHDPFGSTVGRRTELLL